MRTERDSRAKRPETIARLVQDLAGQLQRVAEPLGISSGCETLDQLLPCCGLAPGSLVECLSAGWGSGAAGLALVLAVRACGNRQKLVVVDRHGWFYPPTIVGWGVRWDQLCVVRPACSEDQLWVVDQALRCRAVGAVWTDLERLSPHDFRRLQLAAEQGGGVGMFVRPASVCGEPTWAHVRLLIQPLRCEPSSAEQQHVWQLQVQRLRWRGRWLIPGKGLPVAGDTAGDTTGDTTGDRTDCVGPDGEARRADVAAVELQLDLARGQVAHRQVA